MSSRTPQRLYLRRPSPHAVQSGVVGLLMLLVFTAGVVWVQIQAQQISAGNSLAAQLNQDSLSALYLAESGLERARASLSLAASADPANFQTTCDSFTASGPFTLGRGLFRYLDPQQPSSTFFCALKVEGQVGAARRVLQTGMRFSASSGPVGFGRSLVSGIDNPSSVASVGLFHWAWRRHGSTGHSTSGGNASGSACLLPDCEPLWHNVSSSGSPSVGSMGTAVPMAAHTSAQISQTLSAERNYVGLGIQLSGLTGPPVIQGSFADDKRTANTRNASVTQGDTSSGQANAWCAGADTLVFGVSGRGDDNTAAALNAVVFNTHGSPAQPVAMTRTAHAPNLDGSTPNAFGDVFSEIWTTYNPFVFATQAQSVQRTVTLASPISVQAGTLLKVYSGTGEFAGHTRVLNTVVNATQFQVDKTPSERLINATLCGGICALFHDPSSSRSKTEFTVTRNAAADKEWAGGFTCLTGVDPARIQALGRHGLKLTSWREAVSQE